MRLQNGYKQGHWKKSLKTAGALGIGAFVANLIDPAHIIYTWPWFRHILIASLVVFGTNELGYIQNWLSTSNGGNGNANQTNTTTVVK